MARKQLPRRANQGHSFIIPLPARRPCRAKQGWPALVHAW